MWFNPRDAQVVTSRANGKVFTEPAMHASRYRTPSHHPLATSETPSAPKYELLYATVLEHWKRSHSETAVVLGELRTQEGARTSSALASALARVLTTRRASLKREVIHRWMLAASHIASRQALQACNATLRRERALVKEAQARLAAAEDAELMTREHLARTQPLLDAGSAALAREEQSHRLVTATISTQATPSTATAGVQTEPAALSLQTLAHECEPAHDGHGCQTVEGCALTCRPDASRAAQDPRGRRPMGARAEQLIDAWRAVERQMPERRLETGGDKGYATYLRSSQGGAARDLGQYQQQTRTAGTARTFL